MLRRALALLRRIGFNYTWFVVYSKALDRAPSASRSALPPGYRIAEVTAADLARSPHPELRNCRDYLGTDAVAFGVYRSDGVLVCVQFIWHGDRYRNVQFWSLKAREAASIHLICVEAERGKGLATCLKLDTAERMRERGFTRMYSRIWWTNTASRRVSEHAGWARVGSVLEVKLPGMRTWRRFVRRRPVASAFVEPMGATTGTGRTR